MKTKSLLLMLKSALLNLKLINQRCLIVLILRMELMYLIDYLSPREENYNLVRVI